MSREALPPDPFAGDPDDPARSLEALDGAGDARWTAAVSPDPAPLSAADRREIIADLTDLETYEELLAHRGIRGIVVDCTDCGEQHFHQWNLLRASLKQLLDEGRMRPHEPAYNPEPADYVTWEYCRGYADANIDRDNED